MGVCGVCDGGGVGCAGAKFEQVLPMRVDGACGNCLGAVHCTNTKHMVGSQAVARMANMRHCRDLAGKKASRCNRWKI